MRGVSGLPRAKRLRWCIVQWWSEITSPQGRRLVRKASGSDVISTQRPATKKVSDPQHKSVQHLHRMALVCARTSAPHTWAHTLVSHFTHSLTHGASCVTVQHDTNSTATVHVHVRSHCGFTHQWLQCPSPQQCASVLPPRGTPTTLCRLRV